MDLDDIQRHLNHVDRDYDRTCKECEEMRKEIKALTEANARLTAYGQQLEATLANISKDIRDGMKVISERMEEHIAEATPLLKAWDHGGWLIRLIRWGSITFTAGYGLLSAVEALINRLQHH